MSKPLFGASIDQEVIDQIQVRENSYKGSSSNPLSERTVQDLGFLNYKSAWVRIISSVDVDENKNGQYTPTKSQAFILSGGELLAQDPNRRSTRKEGISFENDDSDFVYRKRQIVGIRPESGITSFNIAHKGTYGALREANIEFIVWSKEDLEIAQDLYLRPGMHLIVEWGNSVYLNNSQRLEQSTYKVNTLGSFFGTSVSDVQQKIDKRRKDSFYNYDGFIGLITNFSWSFRSDGGFDCSIKVVSRGLILESLSMLSSPQQQLTPCDDQGDLKELEYADRSKLHAFIYYTRKQGTENPYGSTWLTSSEEVYPFMYTRYTYTILSINRSASDTNLQLRYITLECLLDLINESFSEVLQDSDGNKRLFILDTDLPENTPPQKYSTFKEHFSLDPTSCLLPISPSSITEEDQEIFNSNAWTDVFLFQVSEPRSTERRFGSRTSLTGTTFAGVTSSSGRGGRQTVNLRNAILGNISEPYIQNILIELNLVKSELDNYYSKDVPGPENVDIYGFIKSILAKINVSLGEVNNLDLHFSEELDGMMVVDREDPCQIQNQSQIKTINLTGTSNTVQQVELRTEITNLLSSQIAISAQGAAAVRNGRVDANIGFLQWNRNVKDRFNVGRLEFQEDPCDTKRDSNKNQIQIYDNYIKSILELGRKRPINTRRRPDTFGPGIFRSLWEGYLEVIQEAFNEFKWTQVSTRPVRNQYRTEISDNLLLPDFQFDSRRLINQINRERTKLIDQTKNISSLTFLEQIRDLYATLFLEFRETKSTLFGLIKWTTSAQFRVEDLDKLRPRTISYFKNKKVTKVLNEENLSDTGLIPLKLSITLDGIGGIRVGEIFKVNNSLLPTQYKDYGFIVTGVNSQIVSGKWNTTIEALTFKLPNTPSGISETSSYILDFQESPESEESLSNIEIPEEPTPVSEPDSIFTP